MEREMSPYRYVQTPATPPPEIDYRAELLASIDDLPPLPVVLNRVLQLLNDSNASSAQIAAMIEKDAVLSGSVLRCVNSAYYGLQSTVTSIRHAVSMLGFSTVRNLALAFSMRRVLTRSRMPPARLYSRYSQHSLSCAVLCHYLVGYTPVPDADAAFATGLFHDIGKLLMLTSFPDLLLKIVEQYQTSDLTYEQVEREVLQLTHSELSRIVLEKWQLPLCIQQAAEYHHHPDDCPHAPDQPITLAHVVQAADLYVNEYGLDLIPNARGNLHPADQAFEAIGLRQRMPEVLEKFKNEYESIRSLF
ncbi:MAG TPA: HDOD domain-containing protein [Bryobacterales bacterium]|nr:HDOD domain-containing protein [Bryobacterales bacterium]